MPAKMSNRWLNSSYKSHEHMQAQITIVQWKGFRLQLTSNEVNSSFGCVIRPSASRPPHACVHDESNPKLQNCERTKKNPFTAACNTSTTVTGCCAGTCGALIHKSALAIGADTVGLCFLPLPFFLSCASISAKTITPAINKRHAETMQLDGHFLAVHVLQHVNVPRQNEIEVPESH